MSRRPALGSGTLTVSRRLALGSRRPSSGSNTTTTICRPDLRLRHAVNSPPAGLGPWHAKRLAGRPRAPAHRRLYADQPWAPARQQTPVGRPWALARRQTQAHQRPSAGRPKPKRPRTSVATAFVMEASRPPRAVTSLAVAGGGCSGGGSPSRRRGSVACPLAAAGWSSDRIHGATAGGSAPSRQWLRRRDHLLSWLRRRVVTVVHRECRGGRSRRGRRKVPAVVRASAAGRLSS